MRFQDRKERIKRDQLLLYKHLFYLILFSSFRLSSPSVFVPTPCASVL